MLAFTAGAITAAVAMWAFRPHRGPAPNLCIVRADGTSQNVHAAATRDVRGRMHAVAEADLRPGDILVIATPTASAVLDITT